MNLAIGAVHKYDVQPCVRQSSYRGHRQGTVCFIVGSTSGFDRFGRLHSAA
jgi:hypothetical protein